MVQRQTRTVVIARDLALRITSHIPLRLSRLGIYTGPLLHIILIHIMPHRIFEYPVGNRLAPVQRQHLVGVMGGIETDLPAEVMRDDRPSGDRDLYPLIFDRTDILVLARDTRRLGERYRR